MKICMKRKAPYLDHNHKYQNMIEYPEVIALDKSSHHGERQ